LSNERHQEQCRRIVRKKNHVRNLYRVYYCRVPPSNVYAHCNEYSIQLNEYTVKKNNIKSSSRPHMQLIVAFCGATIESVRVFQKRRVFVQTLESRNYDKIITHNIIHYTLTFIINIIIIIIQHCSLSMFSNSISRNNG